VEVVVEAEDPDALLAGRVEVLAADLADLKQLAQAAAEGENMPPKSTYFFPKLLTGLLFNPLS